MAVPMTMFGCAPVAPVHRQGFQLEKLWDSGIGGVSLENRVP
jgi:hypothetical protein